MDVTLRWNANSEADLAGYRIYYKSGSSGSPYDGTGLDQGPSPITITITDLGNPDYPEYTLTGLDDTEVYFIVVTAFNNKGFESGFSNEVSIGPVPPESDVPPEDPPEDSPNPTPKSPEGYSYDSGKGGCFLTHP